MNKNLHQNFFELQRHYKRNSLILYGLFLMVMMIHILLALLFFMVLWRIIFGHLDEFAWFWIIILVPAYFLVSILYQYKKLIHNHDTLFHDIDVKRLFMNVSGITIHSPHQNTIYANHLHEFKPKYRRYYEFAEQLAIASNITLPKLYVMDDMSINAFVAGFSDDDMILVVSEGALQLDNESLYALIGHEYGHILHGDAKLNITMYVLISGLSWLYDIADGLEWLSTWRQKPETKRYYLHDDKGTKKEYFMITGTGRIGIEFLSLIIRLVGFLGMVSSEWIKQHFNQQREFLADATAIQLTRSDGIIHLLNTLNKNRHLTQTKKHHTTHLSYFFFLNPQDNHTPLNWRERMGLFGQTHPSNQERIFALNHHEYDDFAKMTISDLDIETLKNTHDTLMKNTIMNDIDTISYHHVIATPETLSNANANATPIDIDIPIYHHDLKISHDKVINGRLVIDDDWKNLHDTDNIAYPTQAKDDYELKDILYININHIKSLHLPLIIARFLRNDGNHHSSDLFILYHAIMICHDTDLLCLDDDIYFNQLFYTQQNNNTTPIFMDKDLLKNIAFMDRRIDNGLLLIIYQRIKQDLNHDNKKSSLIHDYHQLKYFIDNKNHHNTHHDKLALLWRGVHLYRLLSLFYQENPIKINSHLHNDIYVIYYQYHATMNEWIMILLLIKITISHKNTHEKYLHSIYRHIRLINHELSITKYDLEQLITIINQFGVLDIAILLLNYQEKNSLTNKRYIDTLHTSLLGDGIFCERDYEILLTLYDAWCPMYEFTPV